MHVEQLIEDSAHHIWDWKLVCQRSNHVPHVTLLFSDRVPIESREPPMISIVHTTNFHIDEVRWGI